MSIKEYARKMGRIAKEENKQADRKNKAWRNFVKKNCLSINLDLEFNYAEENLKNWGDYEFYLNYEMLLTIISKSL